MKTYDILRKDYKPVVSSCSLRIGISSVTMDSEGLLKRDDLVTSCEKYTVDLDLNVLVIMFLSFAEGSTVPHRELSVFSRDMKSRDEVCRYLSAQEELKLVERSDELPEPLLSCVRLFDQEPKLSRKFVLPILQKMK